MSESGSRDNHARQTDRGASISVAMQDYLKAIYRLQQGDGRATTLNLANELGLSGPSATNMIKRLAELSLVEHNRYHGVRLSSSGEKIALEVIRHHRLLELYLAEAMGFEWDQVHEEAERLEHHVSTEFEARMDELLGHPKFDPHGDPIPSRLGDVPSTTWVWLSELPVGSRAVLRRVSDRDSQQLRYLAEIGLVPGVVLEVSQSAPEGGGNARNLLIAGHRHAIPMELATSMQVEPLV